jgi:hypothetical protein
VPALTSTAHAAVSMPSLHRSICPAGALIQERRSLCQLAVDLVLAGNAEDLDPGVLDNPVSRYLVGEAMAGRGGFACHDLVATESLVGSAGALRAGGVTLDVAADAGAPGVLDGALGAVHAQVDPTLSAESTLRLLCGSDFCFLDALDVVREGLEFVVDKSPELARDLLPHVGLLGILDSGTTGSVVSASHRSFPGLVFIATPSSPIGVAEALIHEGAHQKFFDLAITHSLLTSDSDRCEPYRPPWSGAYWPTEQAFAACHAYACMAQFADDAGVHSGGLELGPTSLLPSARDRSGAIGQWLVEHHRHLDVDALRLLEGMLGRSLSTLAATGGAAGSGPYVAARGLSRRPAGDTGRVVIGRLTPTPEVFILDRAAAAVLRILETSPAGLSEAGLWDAYDRERAQEMLAARAVLPSLLEQLSSFSLVQRSSPNH